MVINFYIDDTGTKEKTDSKTDIFGYCGIAVLSTDEQGIKLHINNLKIEFFKTTDIELKSKWLRLHDERVKRYLNPYNLTDDRLTEFTNKFFTEIKNERIRGLGSIVSKKGLNEKYKNFVYDASPVSYEFLLQRMANLLNQFKAESSSITFDDMSGKNHAGSEWKKLLINQHRRLKMGNSTFYRNWTKRTKMDYSKIPERLNFVDSKSNVLIQIADIFAYNIMRQGRDYKNFDPPKLYPGYEWIIDKMHRDPRSKKITGFGAVFYPL